MGATQTWAEAHRADLLAYGRQLASGQSVRGLDIQDVLQMTLIEAAGKPPPSKVAVAQLAWLKAALRNNFLDEIRKLTAHKRDVFKERRLSGHALSGGDSPSRAIRNVEKIRTLMTNLDQLPPDQQQALKLRYLEELPVEEVAARLGKTRAAAAGLIRRGLAALRDHYDSRPSL
jgi:RNA polymerase sigma-70 factor (ECF subfamily)